MNGLTARPSYASYLPPVYVDDPNGVLAQLLLLFETLMSGREPQPRRPLSDSFEPLPGLEQILDGLARYSDPLTAPSPDGSGQRFFDDDFLPYLASWLALTLRQHWPEAKKRRLIQNIVPLYKKRGTVEGITRFLEIFVEYPIRVNEELGLQVGVRSTVGTDTTVGGLPHRFSVEIDYGERETDEDPAPFDIGFLQQITENTREILNLEKPAHTDYRALYSFPGLIVGHYSTVGWDTLVWPDRKETPPIR